jgi:hypothetical protein
LQDKASLDHDTARFFKTIVPQGGLL